MKLIVTILLTLNIYSQNKKELITSASKNVLIFFESPIVQGITGHSNYQFAYDKVKPSNYGVLRGRKGLESSLHVITADGLVYEFTLNFKEDIKKYNYFINKELSIGTTEGKIEIDNSSLEQKTKLIDTISKIKKDVKVIEDRIKEKSEDSDPYKIDRIKFYKDRAFYLSVDKPFYRRIFSETLDVSFNLEDVKYIRNELYIKITIKNNSGVDYHMNFVRFSKIASKKQKKASYQSLIIKPIFQYNPFGRIPAGEEKTAVYIFEKFGINRDKVFQIEFNENKAERNSTLKIDHKIINNPNT